MREVQIKEIVRKFVRESFKQSISEASYDLGNKQYTDKNMTPTDILDLAMAYSQTSGNKMYGNKMPKMIKVANDLARLNGTIQLDAKTRSKQPALILVLLKNKLVTKDEYIKLYKDLLERQISVIKALKNSDPASRMVGGAAARQAHKDMKGEFEESVNEAKYPTDLKIGSVIKGQGFTRLKGIDGGKYYKIVDMDDTTATLTRTDPSGKVSSPTKVRHKLDSIEAGIKTAKRGDENGIVVIKESVVTEMGVNDVHFKNILRTYDHGGPFTKKKVAVAVTKNPNSSRNKIIDNLRDMDYEEITQVEDDLRISESVEGDKIQNLNNRIKALRDKISATKSPEQKSKFQNTLKNALQSISNIRKAQSESVNESWTVKDGNVLSNGKLIGYYDFDRDSDSFWVDDVKKGKGQLSFDTKKEVEDYFKKNEKDAVKHLGKLRESISEAKSDFEVYHKSYTSAINAAREYAEKQGYEINDDDAFRQIGMGPKKPSEGKVNRFSIELSKDGKVQRKQLQIQVYGMRNVYELNVYIQ